MSRLCVRDLTLGYGERVVLRDLGFGVADGRITVVVGANGCGKSTLLRAMARVLRPLRGEVLLDGAPIHAQRTREVARRIAVLPQGVEAPAGLLVEELVAYGRFPYQSGFGVPTAEDRAAVAWALEVTAMGALASRPIESLSGGERQRAWIAMTLAQQTDVLLLDEPTTFLDIGHQIEVLELIRRLNRERGLTIVMVLHDLNHAARYADEVLALEGGALFASGRPDEVFTPDTLQAVFGIHADVLRHERTGALLCVPYGTPS